MKKMLDINNIYDCIIIGSGISGLSFAHNLKQYDQKILVLEKKKKLEDRF